MYLGKVTVITGVKKSNSLYKKCNWHVKSQAEYSSSRWPKNATASWNLNYNARHTWKKWTTLFGRINNLSVRPPKLYENSRLTRTRKCVTGIHKKNSRSGNALIYLPSEHFVLYLGQSIASIRSTTRRENCSLVSLVMKEWKCIMGAVAARPHLQQGIRFSLPL